MLKRAFDLSAAFLGLIILLPLFVILGIVVKLDSPGPIFYRARRVGQYGKEFHLFKFRSMIANADKFGPGVTGAGDSRVTSVGRFLRRTKLDELPQLINVLRGEMSIVGPRPEDPRYVALYTLSQKRVLDVRPGITSPASVTYRNEEVMLSDADWETMYVQQVMPVKLEIDLEYAANPTVLRDIQVIGKTLLALFRRT